MTISRIALILCLTAIPGFVMAVDLSSNRAINLCLGLFRAAQGLQQDLETPASASVRDLLVQFRQSVLTVNRNDVVTKAKPLVLHSGSANPKALLKLAQRIQVVEHLQSYKPAKMQSQISAVAPDEESIENFFAKAFEVNEEVAAHARGPHLMIEEANYMRLYMSLAGLAMTSGTGAMALYLAPGMDPATLMGTFAIVGLSGIATQADGVYHIWKSQNHGLIQLARLYEEFKSKNLSWAYWSQDVLLTESIATQLAQRVDPSDIRAFNEAETINLFNRIIKYDVSTTRTSQASIDVLFWHTPQPTMVFSFYSAPKPKFSLPAVKNLISHSSSTTPITTR